MGPLIIIAVVIVISVTAYILSGRRKLPGMNQGLFSKPKTVSLTSSDEDRQETDLVPEQAKIADTLTGTPIAEPIPEIAEAVQETTGIFPDPAETDIVEELGPVVSLSYEGAAQEEKANLQSRKVRITTTITYPTAEDIGDDIRELIKSGISCLPKLPGATLEILPLLSKPGCGSKEIAEIIERDQPMAARLLRWVNSSFYGLEMKVSSLHNAVTLLGINVIRSMVLEDSFSRLNRKFEVDGLKLVTIWKHAAAVSCTARHLARQARNVEVNVAATAGLLHDVGLLIMLIMSKDKICDILKASRESDEPMIAHEFNILGANHQIYGELFVEAWNLPNEIRHAVGRHHNPLMEPFSPIVAITWLSDILVSCIGFACPENQVPDVSADEINHVMKLAGLNPPLDRYLTETLAKYLVNSTRFFSENGSDAATSDEMITRV